MRTGHAQQIRAGILAARLPHRLREIWTRAVKASPLTIQAFLRTRDLMRSDPRSAITPEQRASAARIRITYDRKRGAKTPQWIVDLATDGSSNA